MGAHQLGSDLVGVGVLGGEEGRGAAMVAGPRRGRSRLVDGVAHQRVGEAERLARLEDAGRRQAVEGSDGVCLLEPGQGDRVAAGGFVTEHRAGGDQRRRLLAQPAQPGFDRGGDAAARSPSPSSRSTVTGPSSSLSSAATCVTSRGLPPVRRAHAAAASSSVGPVPHASRSSPTPAGLSRPTRTTSAGGSPRSSATAPAFVGSSPSRIAITRAIPARRRGARSPPALPSSPGRPSGRHRRRGRAARRPPRARRPGRRRRRRAPRSRRRRPPGRRADRRPGRGLRQLALLDPAVEERLQQLQRKAERGGALQR